MPAIEKSIEYLFPQSMLEGTPWLASWQSKEHQDFRTIARLFFPIAAIVYVAHFLFFDLAMGLQPVEHWLIFRASMAGIALVASAYYFSELSNTKFYRTPAILANLAFCYFQARVTIWYPEAPWLYCFLFVGISTLLLRASVVKSTAYALTAIGVQWASLVEANIEIPVIASASVVTIILILTSRSGYSAEIKYFLLSQQNLDSQKRNIELNIEFTDRIKSFIPGEIARRLESKLEGGRTTVLQAIEHVLRPKKKHIACLFSDIRGFTEASKDLESFIGDLVLPNVKACTNTIDAHGGIPRKIGDLIFAYFDHENPSLSLVNAMASAMDISRINESQNNGSTGQNIERYILVASGQAFVGNIGGFDSSVEITALGSPVNYLSRIDEITKAPEVAEQLRSGDIIVSNASMLALLSMGIEFEAVRIELDRLGIEVRNFPDEKHIYIVKPSRKNALLLTQHARLADGVSERWRGENDQVA
jgi:class 3 adenylate cyclase